MDDMMRALLRLSGHYVPYLEPYWEAETFEVVNAWLRGGALTDGADKLRAELKSRFPQSIDIVLTDTGKSALYVALKMLGTAPRDEVIVPSYCCVSIIASVLRADCIPVFADTDEQFNISAESVAAMLSSRTKVVLVPHLFGQMAASLEAIVALVRQRGIAIIEDVAQAYGLQLNGKALAGSVGDAAIFSAGLGKPIMGPGGGWVVLNRTCSGRPDLMAETIEESRARVAGFLSRFTGPYWRRGYAEIAYALPARLAVWKRREPGFNLRSWAEKECRIRTISDIDAWLAKGQIERIDSNIEGRRQNARRWKALLAAAKVPCSTPPDEANIYTALPLLFQGKDASHAAQKCRHALERGGIATEPCYTPLHLRVEGREFKRSKMTFCESVWQQVFAVPVRPNLLPGDWDRIETVVALAGASSTRMYH